MTTKMASQQIKDVDIKVKTLSELGYSSRAIVKQLKSSGISVSQSTVVRITGSKPKKRLAAATGENLNLCAKPRGARNKPNLKKVKLAVDGPNPMSQRAIAKRVGISQPSVNRIIHQDLDRKTTRKTKCHRLSPAHCQNRKTNSRKLYENCLAGDRAEFAVTLDEAYVYLDHCNGERRICYVKRGEQVPDEWLVYCNERWPKGFMVVGGMTGRGTLPLLRVEKNVKVTAEYYVEKVLKRYLEVEVPKIYPGEVSKVMFHHDKASSHTANLTTQYLQDLKERSGLNFIPKELIPVKSPDISPMDFFAFGFLKQVLFLRKASTLPGLWKVLQDEWTKVTPAKCTEVFDSWKRRCRAVSKHDGQHIEQTKNIHRRLLKDKN